jgi:hypothetical protein
MTYRAANEVTLAENQVAIAITDGAFGSHLGIAYSMGSGHCELLHLAFHKKLTLEKYPPVGSWAVFVIDIPESLSVQLVAILDAMGTRYQNNHNEGIAYGINLYDSLKSIAPDGDYVLDGEADGLTCASFIAAVFAAMEVPLIDLVTWKADAINKIWGNAVICLLNIVKADAKHIDNVSRNNLGIRVRPEEIAAAGVVFSPGKSASYSEVQGLAQEIIWTVRLLCGEVWQGDDSNAFARCVKEYYLNLDELLQKRQEFLEGLRNLLTIRSKMV